MGELAPIDPAGPWPDLVKKARAMLAAGAHRWPGDNGWMRLTLKSGVTSHFRGDIWQAAIAEAPPAS